MRGWNSTPPSPPRALTVELLDPASGPLDGWPPSDPLSGDNLRHTVTFRGSPDVSPLANRPIVLRFTLNSTELYSFAFPGAE